MSPASPIRFLALILSLFLWATPSLAAKQKAVVVVDAMSSGAEWLDILKAEDPNVVVIHVQTMEEIPNTFLKPELIGQSSAKQAEGMFGKFDYHFSYGPKTAQQIKELGFDVLAVLRGTETAIYDSDKLAADLKVPQEFQNSSDPALRLARRNKEAQQQALLKVPTIGHRAFKVVKTFDELKEFIEAHGQNGFVFKPLESAGSNQQGVFPSLGEMGNPNGTLAERYAKVRERFNEVMASKDLFDQPIREVIIEQFLRGTEFQVNAFIVDGRIEFTSFVRYYKDVVSGKGVLPDHDEWLPYEGELQEQLRKIVSDLVKALGINFDSIHAEILRDENGVFHVVEIANRPAGSRIPVIEMVATGKSKMQRLARRLLNPARFERETTEGYKLLQHPRKVAFRYSGPTGKISSLELFKQLEKLPTFYRLIEHYKVGDEISASTSLTDNLALVWLVGSADEVERDLRTIRNLEVLSPNIRLSKAKNNCTQIYIDFLSAISPEQ